MLIALAVVLAPLPWALFAVAFRRGDESLTEVVPLAVLAVLALAFARPVRQRADRGRVTVSSERAPTPDQARHAYPQ